MEHKESQFKQCRTDQDILSQMRQADEFRECNESIKSGHIQVQLRSYV
jgi:hypothetical protein